MAAGDATTPPPPIVANSAPRVRLVTAVGTDTEATIECRRVVTLLGSREGCKVRLPHARVAAVHAAIVNSGSNVLAVDLITPHGTLLNELKLEHERLQNGDMLQVGPWQFQVDIQAADSKDGDAHSLALEPTPQVIAFEHLATQRILRPTRNACVIGRRSGCDIALSDNSVSRAHAILFTYFGFPAIFDLLSENGTRVDGTSVSFKLLKNDEVVAVGDTEFRVRLVASSVGEQAAKGSNGSGPPSQPTPQGPSRDLIDIQQVEGSQRWRVAESLKKAAKKS